MIPVEQRQLHSIEKDIQGDCFSATLASLLHLNIEDVPLFAALDNWQYELNRWLEPFGIIFISFEYNQDWMKLVGAEDVYHEICGPSPRFPDLFHSVVGRGGDCHFDPHPEGTGVNKIESIGLFVLRDPGKFLQR